VEQNVRGASAALRAFVGVVAHGWAQWLPGAGALGRLAQLVRAAGLQPSWPERFRRFTSPVVVFVTPTGVTYCAGSTYHCVEQRGRSRDIGHDTPVTEFLVLYLDDRHKFTEGGKVNFNCLVGVDPDPHGGRTGTSWPTATKRLMTSTALLLHPR